MAKRNRLFAVSPRHWWQWLTPRFWRTRKLLRAYMDENEEEILRDYNAHIKNAILFGTYGVYVPKDFYGKGIADMFGKEDRK